MKREIYSDYSKMAKIQEAEKVEQTDELNPLQYKVCRAVEVVEPILDLSDYLPEVIANPLMQVAKAMPTSPEIFLTTLLPVSASLIGTAATVHVKGNWKEPAIIWAMNIAPTGSLKSPTMDVIIDPLWQLDDEESDSRDYIVDDFTMEALIQVHENNRKGLLVYRDELDGLFKSANKYRGGKGDDSQRWLSLYSGKHTKTNRKGNDGSTIKLNKTAVSITGSIQPEILEGYLEGENVHNGTSSRWLLCKPLMPSAKFIWQESPDVSDILSQMYSKLDKIPNDSVFLLSDEAKKYFVERWHDPIVDRAEKETIPSIRAVLSKLKGYCVRIALVLHSIHEVATGIKTDSEKDFDISKEIPIEIIKKAIKLSYFYLAQAESVYGVVKDSESCLSEVWVILRDLSKEKGGWIKAREACQKTKKIKGADNFRKLFQEMAEAGFGEIRGEGKNIEWKYIESIEIASTLLRNAESIAA